MAVGFCLALQLAEGVLLLFLLWEIIAYTLGIDLRNGHYDFLAFYSGAYFVLHEQVFHLYNASAIANLQRTLVHQAVGAGGYMPFLNPPFQAVLQAPFALFSAPAARVVWLAGNAILGFNVVHSMTRPIVKWRLFADCILLGTFPIYQTLVEGQWSLILLFGCLMALRHARQGRPVFSGLWLSVLWFKPQLGAIVLLWLIAMRFWRIGAAMVGMLFLMIVATLPITGLSIYSDYPPFLLQVLRDHFNGAGAVGPTVWQGALSLTEGLNGLFIGIVGQSSVRTTDILTVIAVGLTLLVYSLALRRVKPGLGKFKRELMLVGSLGLILLIDPHLYPQDLTLSFVALPILLPYTRRKLQLIVALCFLVDLPVLDLLLPVHLFTIVTWTLLIVVLVRMATSPSTLLSRIARQRASSEYELIGPASGGDG